MVPVRNLNVDAEVSFQSARHDNANGGLVIRTHLNRLKYFPAHLLSIAKPSIPRS